MCGLAEAALVTSVLASGMSAVQQRQIGKANAKMAEAEAAQAREIGRIKEQTSRDRMKVLRARQRGQLAARGVRLDSTTALQLGQDAGVEDFMEAQVQRYNTDSAATAKTNEGRLHEYRGQMGFLTGMANAGAKAMTGAVELWPGLAGG